jgi:transposase
MERLRRWLPRRSTPTSCASARSGSCSSRGRPIAQVAADLGIHREALRKWVRQAEADSGRRGDRLTTSERERLKTLERENRELKKANEILKAASVFFAKELDPPRPK